MNTINVAAFANSHIADEIAMRSGHASRSSFKRQSRRQVRHRLAAQLRTEMAHHLAEAVEMGVHIASATADRSAALAPVSTATIIAFPGPKQRAAQAVQVIRKTARLPFERQHLEVTFLAA